MKFTFPRPSLWHWLCGLAVILVSFSPVLTGLLGIQALLPKHTIFYGASIPFLLAFFEKYSLNASSSLKVLSAIIAFIFSQFVTVEGSFYHVHSWALCFSSGIAILTWCLRSIVFGFVFYKIFLGIAYIIENTYASSTKEYKLDYRKWLFLIVCTRLFALFLFYPLVFGFDSAVGLRTYMDPDCATCNHHPYFIQLIHAIFYNIGKEIGHLSVGFFILGLLSILFSSTIILYGIRLMQHAKLSRRLLLAFAVTYTLFPLYPYLAINPTKDGLFAYTFLLYLFTLFELYFTDARCLNDKRYLFLHGVTILLVCLTRHQGFYIVLVECALLLLCYKNNRKRLLLMTVPSLCLVLTYNNVLLPFINVEPAGKQEIYGTLFQQTAYYLQKHPDDVAMDDLAAINKVLNSDTIVAKYVCDTTDPVKNGYKYNPWYRLYIGAPSIFRHIDHSHEAEDLNAYRSAWLSMGFRHPLTYMEASLAVSAGFFYNFNRLLLETEPKWAENGAATTPEYRFVHFNKTARIYNNRIYSWFKYPVLNWIIAIPYYNWAAIFFLGILFYRKDFKGLIIFLPILSSLGILLICPMVYGRYAYPIAMGLPLLVIYTLYSKNRN